MSDNTFDIDTLTEEAMAFTATDEAQAAITLEDGSEVDPETGEVSAPAGDLSTLEGCIAVVNDLMGPLPSVRPGEYPYHGKKAIKAKLQTDERFAAVVFVTMFQLQTEWEKQAHATKDKNRRGLSSSHAGANGKHGYTSALIANGGNVDALDPEARERVTRWGAMYTKQTAALLRQAAGPELAVTARVFFGG